MNRIKKSDGDKKKEDLIETKYIKFFNKNSYGTPLIQTSLFKRHIVYADFTASGQLFKTIEKFMQKNVYPFYANTHSNAYSGKLMVHYIKQSKDIIRQSINADKKDSVIFTGQGCSTAVTHFVHILNLNKNTKKLDTVVFVTDFEHNSNFLPWKHAGVELVIIPTNENNGLVDETIFEKQLKKYSDKKQKIISFSAGSNISGILQNISRICILGHKYGFIVAFDFAAVAPYTKIDMHKNDKSGDYIDALFLSPHKFLGGPGTPGILVANNKLFSNKCPFYPSGGTVRYASRDYNIYSENNEVKEMGGTPNILGCIKIGLVFLLKNKLLSYITKKEKVVCDYSRKKLNQIKNLKVIIPNCGNNPNITQIPIFSFIIEGLHYNFVVVLLNDLFGIQTRGGVSCSGIYAEKILKLSRDHENEIVKSIVDNKGVPKEYGWCRVTFHYTMPFYIIKYILKSIQFVAEHGESFLHLYKYSSGTNLWEFKNNVDIFKNIKLNFQDKYESCDGVCITKRDTLKNLLSAEKFLEKLSKLEFKNKLNSNSESDQSGNYNTQSDNHSTFSMT